MLLLPVRFWPKLFDFWFKLDPLLEIYSLIDHMRPLCGKCGRSGRWRRKESDRRWWQWWRGRFFFIWIFATNTTSWGEFNLGFGIRKLTLNKISLHFSRHRLTNCREITHHSRRTVRRDSCKSFFRIVRNPMPQIANAANSQQIAA